MKFALALIALATAASTSIIGAEGVDCTVDTVVADCQGVTATDVCCKITTADMTATLQCVSAADSKLETFEDNTSPTAIKATVNSCYVADEEDSAMTLIAGAAAVATLALF